MQVSLPKSNNEDISEKMNFEGSEDLLKSATKVEGETTFPLQLREAGKNQLLGQEDRNIKCSISHSVSLKVY